MPQPDSVLALGGLLPASTDAAATDLVDALAFTHPAISGRTVVRLVPQALTRGESSRFDLCGFRPEGSTAAVARQRRRAVGFPEWALLHDPANARFALEVMKDFTVARKRIASKPGHARDAFAATAATLGRSAPHFLPSFWEEAGRAFAAAGSLPMAASAFEKARAAEREHGLPVDESARAESFLEFALAGALTVKSLQAWAGELRKTEGPGVALERFTDLCVRRTLGGLAPWAGLAKDLRELARAAGEDPVAREITFLRTVLTAPSLRRAPLAFWKDVAGARLAATPEGAAALANVFPTWHDDDQLGGWLDLLQGWGVVTALATNGLAGGVAAWLGRVFTLCDGCPTQVLAISRALADRLLAEGAPVPVFDEEVYRVECLDAMEHLLGRGVALQVADPDHGRFHLDGWAGQPGERQDPVLVAAHPALGPILRRSVVAAMDEEDFQRVAVGMTAFREARHEHLRETVASLAAAALPGAAEALEHLEAVAPASALADFPDVVEALAALSLAEPLARSLRGGVLDELGWPAFEEAVAELRGANQADVEVEAIAPWCVLHDDRRALVVGPAGREATHDLKLPKGRSPAGFRWSDGQLLVVARVPGDWSKFEGYWSGRPKELVPLTFEHRWRSTSRTPPLPSGGVLAGRRALRAGDTAVDIGTAWCDAEGVWGSGDDGLFAVDPATGKPRGPDAPAFLADRDGVRPALDDCRYHPEPSAGSPLGVQGGQYGWARFDLSDLDPAAAAAWRARHVPRPTLTKGEDPRDIGLTLDGRSWVGDHEALGLLAWPGTDAPRALLTAGWRDAALYADGQVVAAIDDDLPAYRAGTPLPVPVELWHHLRPRDLDASARLRAVTADDAAALLTLAAGQPDDEAGWDVVAPQVTLSADPALRRGIAGVVCLAASLQARLDALRSERTGDGATDVGGSGDRDLREVLSGIAYGYWDDLSVAAAIRTSSAFLAGSDAAPRRSELPWWDWLATPGALLYVALSPVTTAEERATLWPILTALAESVFARSPVRRLKVTAKRTASWLRWVREYGDESLAEGWAFAAESRYLVIPGDVPETGDVTVELLELAGPSGWALPADASLVGEARELRVDGEWLAAAVAAGPSTTLPCGDSVYATITAETGLSRPEAAAVVGGLRGFRGWSSDPLTKAGREALGLKLAEAKLAKDTLNGVPLDKRARAFHAAVAGIPAASWATGDLSAFPRLLAEGWVAAIGRRVPLDEALLADSRKDFPGGDGPTALVALANLAAAASWQNDAAWRLDASGDLERADLRETSDGEEEESAAVFDEDALRLGLGTLAWVYAHTAVGDPLRARLPELHAALRARLAAPGLRIVVIEGSSKPLLGWFKKFGGAEVTLPAATGDDAPSSVPVARHAGGVTAVLDDRTVRVILQPGDVSDDDLAHLRKLAADDENWKGTDPLDTLRAARVGGLVAIAERSAIGAPEGAWEQDPRVSAPEVVGRAQAKLGLSPEGAVLYLQLLTLADPTRANTLRWNGWKPAMYTKAVGELVERSLVLEAKRARAGRDHFLPGGWHERRSGSLPLEEWKLPLYGGAEPPLGAFVPMEPFGALYARAWARIEAGDVPKYERRA